MNPMKRDVIVHHVAVECGSQELAERFFSLILGLPKVKSTLLSEEVAEEIFQIRKEVRFDFYENEGTRFEVFVTDTPVQSGFAHVCISVGDKNGFVSRCKEQGLAPFFVQKDGKELLFVRDFTGNLYEVK